MRVYKCRKVGGKFSLSKKVVTEVLDVVADGGLVVYPTETVYGLAADPFNEDAVKRVFKVKRRPKSMPISMAVPSYAAIWFYALLDEHSIKFCEKHMPGPVTVILRANSRAPTNLVSKDRLIGFRVPEHTVAAQLLRVISPLTATSANRHGRPPPVTCDEAIEQLGGDVDIYLDAGPCKYRQESTVVDLSDGETRIIRPGALSQEDF